MASAFRGRVRCPLPVACSVSAFVPGGSARRRCHEPRSRSSGARRGCSQRPCSDAVRDLRSRDDGGPRPPRERLSGGRRMASGSDFRRRCRCCSATNAAGLSATNIARLTASCDEEYQAFRAVRSTGSSSSPGSRPRAPPAPSSRPRDPDHHQRAEVGRLPAGCSSREATHLTNGCLAA